ncbi:hypothetical protein [Halorubrum sp. JWXQ-INN 858]|uniref:DUF7317 family protein n=1 Tax=Halorubrum sp. JWXQ-INN 858 TaxID=2690782 RepID=UPI00190F1681|nr:hypothetical protein [Halorubrum sp. JWXQ-INN 858]
MTSHSVTTALTLYRSRTITLEQAATASGCTPEQLRASARAVVPNADAGTEPAN